MLTALLATGRLGVAGLSSAARLGPLAAIQTVTKLGACAQQQQWVGRWAQQRGFAAGPSPPPPAGSDGSQPAGKAAEQQAPAAAAQHSAAAGQPPEATKSAAAQAAPEEQPPASQQEARAASAADAGEGGGEQQRQVAEQQGAERQQQGAERQQQEQPLEPPKLAQDHPELRQYIEGLQKLKGSTTVQRQTVGGEQAWWQALLSGWLGPMVQGWIVNFVQTRVEKDFDPEEFLEGAQDAVWAVYELLKEEDWEGLRPLMSAKLHAAFKDTSDAYREAGLVWRTELEGTPAAAVRGLGFFSPEMMREYDADIAAQAGGDQGFAPGPGGKWLVLTVQYRGEQRTTITREADGQVVAELRDLRPQHWKFATGPLPDGLPVGRLETSWFLLSI